jgi:hypothetical protein|tara:strand:- start:227 stop:652 length:426 start_codon:yes stop_codon:yes gene_type:complete
MQTPYQLSLNEVQNTQENITTSESQSKPPQQSVIRGPKHTDCTRKGDYYEALVQLKAWERGAEVFKNAGASGSVDMIIIWEGKTLKCDVKAMDYNKPWGNFQHKRPAHCTEDVQLISVHPQTKQISFPPNRTPAGWENFWS